MAKGKSTEHRNLEGPTVAQQLMEPFTRKLQAKLERQVDGVAKALTDGLKAKTTKHFAFQGKVVNKRDYIDHGIRIKAATEITEMMGAYAPKRIESKHDHTGTIFHDLGDRMEKAIEATEDAIRNGNRADRKPKGKKRA